MPQPGACDPRRRGAAERRCKQLPPYEKAWEDAQYWFGMPTEVADVVQELAGKHDLDSYGQVGGR